MNKENKQIINQFLNENPKNMFNSVPYTFRNDDYYESIRNSFVFSSWNLSRCFKIFFKEVLKSFKL